LTDLSKDTTSISLETAKNTENILHKMKFYKVNPDSPAVVNFFEAG